jgi:hypothetical protein
VAKGNTFELVPVDFIPEKHTLYQEIVMEFSKGAVKEVLVKMDGVKAKSIRVGLRRAINSLNIPVKDIMRGEEVYLAKDF